jgi:hypothetical protein
MATRAILTPNSAEFPGSNFPQLTLSDATRRRPVLAFDATTEETCYWTFVAPQGLTGTVTLLVFYGMASGTSGGVAFGASVEAVTPADALDLDAGDSFDTENVGTDAAVPGTAGYMESVSITLTTADSIAAGDLVRVRLARKVANASDTATGDALVFAAEFRDAA